MNKSKKNPHTLEWNKKISDGVKRQHAEGRGFSPGFSDKQRKKGRDKNWRGEMASRAAKHAWVRRWKGTPQVCEKCGDTTKRKYEWANIDHKYHRILDDYIRLCTSCHRNYDIKNNNYQNDKK